MRQKEKNKGAEEFNILVMLMRRFVLNDDSSTLPGIIYYLFVYLIAPLHFVISKMFYDLQNNFKSEDIVLISSHFLRLYQEYQISNKIYGLKIELDRLSIIESGAESLQQQCKATGQKVNQKSEPEVSEYPNFALE